MWSSSLLPFNPDMIIVVKRHTEVKSTYEIEEVVAIKIRFFANKIISSAGK